jgi:hypothetical protein
MLFGGPISWRSKKQPVVSLSTTEAEYKAVVEAGQELMWLRTILSDLRIATNDPITIFNDNQGCISLATNPVFRARTKHIEIQYHWIREKLNDGKFKLIYKPTSNMTADCFTKSLSRILHKRFCENMGLTSLIQNQ